MWWRLGVIFSGFCHPARPSVSVTRHTLIQPAALAFIPRLITVRASPHTSGSWQVSAASLSLCSFCTRFSQSALSPQFSLHFLFHPKFLPSLTLSCLLLTLCRHVFHPHLFTALYFLHAPFLPPPFFFFFSFSKMLSLLQFSFLAVCSSLQALQALQRQPNAAQYFQQLMLQQQINNAAQLQNLAAVQQVKVCANFTLFLSSKGSYKHPARVVCKAQRKTIVRNKTIHDDAITALHKTDCHLLACNN